MTKLTAAQKRYIENARLISALQLIFHKLEDSKIPIYRLSELAETTSGGTPSRTATSYYGGDIPWIKSGELNDGIIEQAEEFISYEGLKNSSAKIYPKGTLVIALYGATVGKLGILGIDAASNQAVCAVKPKTNKISTNFLFWFLRYKRQDFLNDSFGGAQPNISQKILRETCLPLPDKELQENICDFLKVVEKRQNGETHLDLPQLPTMLEEQRRILTRVEELVGKIEEVRSLRQKAAKETEFIIGASQEKFFSPNADSIKLGTISTVIDPNPSHRYPIYVDDGIPIISTVDFVGNNEISTKNVKRVPLSFYEDTLGRFGVGEDDIIFSRKGKVGYARPYPANMKLAMTHTLCVIQPDRNKVLPGYLLHYTRSPAFINYLIGTMNPNVGVPTLGLGVIRSAPFNLPSLCEQRHIVAYLDELQTKVDTMRKLREETIKELDALLPSILDKAFKGEL
ncbi:restriction endonuclease subunit S [Anabaena sp. CCY 9910]|uniref:restriction endonuclease subunit S n=1 Tax=Anabaena sp. CCY 9910 TaxID=3103870 RepID=UPI0039E0E887